MFLYVLCCFDFFRGRSMLFVVVFLVSFLFSLFCAFLYADAFEAVASVFIFIIVCRLWSVIFMPPFFISRVRAMLFTVVFPPSLCRPFLVIFLCPFCLLQSCLLPPVFLVVFVLRRKGLFPCLCVRAVFDGLVCLNMLRTAIYQHKYAS